jgi:hypothetical protein
MTRRTGNRVELPIGTGFSHSSDRAVGSSHSNMSPNWLFANSISRRPALHGKTASIQLPFAPLGSNPVGTSASGPSYDAVAGSIPQGGPGVFGFWKHGVGARLAAVGQRLNAMLRAVKTVRMAMDDFYGSLIDEQKAAFDAIGPQQAGGRRSVRGRL